MDTRTELNVLSICSGYGGIELGLDAALAGRTRTICYVENEISVAAILAARMEDGSIDKAPIWTDLTTFQTEPFRGKVDLLCGGFPCQPHSQAGAQLHGDDPRELSGEVLRIADGLGLPDLFLENVPGILRFYWDNIRPELRKLGYSQIAEGLFTASETGAPHKRERLFILAHTNESGIWDQAGTIGFEDVRQGDGTAGTVRPSATSPELAHAADRRVRAQPGSLGTGPTSKSLEWSQSTEESTSRSNELAHAAEQGLQAGEPSGLGGSPTAQSQRRDQPTTKSMHSYPQELAHAERNDAWRGGYELGGTPPANQGTGNQRQRIRPDSGDGSPELAHAEEYGVQEPRPTNQPKGKHASTTPISNGEALADADGLRHVHEQPGVEPGGGGLDAQRHAAEGGGELADTDRAGPQGWDECRDSAGERATGTSGSELGELPLYPPAPNDHAGWEWLLARWPELAPTYCKDGHDVQPEMSQIESKLRGASPGTPTGVDRRLRAIGNGVVPAVAAVAFRTLSSVLRAG